METMELTREEIELIEEHRKNKKVNETLLKRKATKFLNDANKLGDLATELYDLSRSNEKAEQVIKEVLDMDFIRDIYEVMVEYENKC